ncbi:MAG: YitT family protein [Mycoplasma sp.]
MKNESTPKSSKTSKVTKPKNQNIDMAEFDAESPHFSIPIKKVKKTGQSFDKLKVYIQNKGFLERSKNFEAVNFRSKLVKFSFLFQKQGFRKQLLMLVLLALSMSVVSIFLIQNSGLYSAGVAGVFQGIARIVETSMRVNGFEDSLIEPVYNSIFWGSYFIANIPLLIFAYKKISKQFAYMTIVYILFNQLFGFALSFIPDIHNIHIFGNTIMEIPQLPNSGIPITNWTSTGGSFNLFIYSLLAGLLTGVQFAIIYIIGGSTGGTDIISFYYAKKKNKSIGSMLAIINIVFLFIAVTLGSLTSLIILSPDDVLKDANSFIQNFFSPNLMFSILMTVIVSAFVNFLFPKLKFTQIKIYTSNAKILYQKLINVGYKHDVFINELKNTMSTEPVFTLETICMYIELPEILSTIRSVDSTSMISINRLSDIDGEMLIIK